MPKLSQEDTLLMHLWRRHQPTGNGLIDCALAGFTARINRCTSTHVDIPEYLEAFDIFLVLRQCLWHRVPHHHSVIDIGINAVFEQEWEVFREESPA